MKFQRFLENSPKISEEEEIRLGNKGAEIEKILMEIAQISDYLANFNNLQQPDMQEGIYIEFLLLQNFRDFKSKFFSSRRT